MTQYRRAFWAALALGLFVLEVAIATVWARVPVVRADLGDYFVVLLIYAAAKVVRPFRATPLAVAVFLLGVLVECAQYFSLADRLGFARGGVGSIVMGNTFGLSDVWMYAAGAMTAWVIDRSGRASLSLRQRGEGQG
jgi:hypothetical protein